jgi:serine/threonine-protein kinase
VDAEGTLIAGRYQLAEVVGEGGMATVYRATIRGAAGFARPVAIKKIRPEYRQLKHYIDMFIEEARVGAELAHPNIVQVHDFCSDDQGALYLVMEWVDGVDVGAFIKYHRETGQPMRWDVAATVAIGTLRGLAAAHERRAADGTPSPVIHRDVSPQNILLGANGAVKLSDFGLARARDRAYSLTAPGTVKGKLAYLAPEVTNGKPNSPRSDLFAMGTVLWEAMTWQRLFDGRSDLEIFKQIRACKVPPLGVMRPDLPAAFVAAIETALALDPAGRHASAADFARALTDALRVAGGDPAAALCDAVINARGRLRGLAGAAQDDLKTTSMAPPPPSSPSSPATPSVPITIDSDIDVPSLVPRPKP